MNPSRRRFFLAAGAAAATPIALQACSGTDAQSYEQAAQRIREASAARFTERSMLMRELVRNATLAPSSHNTQCWKFAMQPSMISILPDRSRGTPVVDPDEHHLFVSLGCAAENLVQAARAHGLAGEADFRPGASDAVRISLAPTRALASSLYQALPHRQCTRAVFDGTSLSGPELGLLEQAAAGSGIRMLLLTDRAEMEKVLEFVVQANTSQMNDPAFVDELKAWIRFSDAEAVRTGDGLFSRASGNPSVPRWLGSALFPAFYRPGNENDKYAKQLRSSAGIAVFVSAVNDKAHWIQAGRSYERFALQATALGLRTAFLNQPVEVAALRPGFASFLGVGDGRPDLVVRFGRGPAMPRSLRRPLEAVITSSSA